MNYKETYNKLTAPNLRKKGGRVYYEWHHIVPKCLGGSDDPSNLVLLTPKEHLLAHRLLCLIHPNNYKLAYAFHMMVKEQKTKPTERDVREAKKFLNKSSTRKRKKSKAQKRRALLKKLRRRERKIGLTK